MRGNRERLAELLEAAEALVGWGEPELTHEECIAADEDGDLEMTDPCFYCDTWPHEMSCPWARLKGIAEKVRQEVSG